jgi:hypothetical protein
MIPLTVLVEERIVKKKRRAEDAFLRAKKVKVTENCRHHGASLSEHLYVCKLRCQGANETDAGICHNQKAAGCPDFTVGRTDEAIRGEFRGFTDSEVAIRWPSIGELMWVRRQLSETAQEKLPQEEPEKKAS